MTVLVTGGCGYIGSHTCVQLMKAGYTPVILDNLCNSKRGVLARIEQITGKSPIFYHGDVRDRNLLDRIFHQHNINAVIHFAGLKAVGESVSKPLEYYDVNVYGAIVLAQAMRAADVKHLIFSSSATVYGEQPTIPYHEEMPVGQPSNPYGYSKLMVERCLADLINAENNWSITILRYFNPVGAHPSGLMGEDPQGIPNNLMPYIAQVAIGLRPTLSVFGNDYATPDGTCIRDYIHVVDLADGHLAALKAMEKQPTGLRIYNLGSGQGTSVLDVIHAFEQASGKPLNWQFAKRRAGDLARYWADPSKAKRELNWHTIRNLNDMACDVWRWQSQNPQGYPD